MKPIKKLLGNLLVFILLISMVNNVYAQEVDGKLTSQKTVNVYAETINHFDEQLYGKNFNFANLSKVKSEKELYIQQFDKHIIDIGEKYSDKELREYYNYKDEQIYAIRNFDGTEAMRMLAAATMNFNFYESAYNYNSVTDVTYLTVNYSMNTNGIDTSNYQRNIALGALGSQASYFHISSNVTAIYTSGSKTISYGYDSRSIENGAGVVMSFQNKRYQLVDPAAGLYEEYYLQSFSSHYTAVAGGKVTIGGITAAFAKPSVSFGGFGLSFDLGGPSISVELAQNWSFINNSYKTVRMP